MRISSLIYLFVFLLTFLFYFYYLYPLLGEMWQRFLVFIALYALLSFVRRKLEQHFESLSRRINKELSVWIVIGLLAVIVIFGVFK